MSLAEEGTHPPPKSDIKMKKQTNKQTIERTNNCTLTVVSLVEVIISFVKNLFLQDGIEDDEPWESQDIRGAVRKSICFIFLSFEKFKKLYNDNNNSNIFYLFRVYSIK